MPSAATLVNALRCSTLAREVGLDPIGTAGHHSGFLLVEWPLPWPEDVGQIDALERLAAALASTGIRLQCLVPQDQPAASSPAKSSPTKSSPAETKRRVVLYRRPPGVGFAGYHRVERDVPTASLVDAAIDLVTGDQSAEAESSPLHQGWSRNDEVGPSLRSQAVSAPVDDMEPGRRGDVLICTHGRRDICCGSKGMALVGELTSEPTLAGTGYRLSRTSHTGGHRFAPTAIVLPEGTMWAFLDRGLVARIARREGAVDEILAHYRGCSGVGSPAVQAVEGAAFTEIGWDWLDWRRWGERLHDGRIRLVGEDPDGNRRTWIAAVQDRVRPIPVCGKPLGEAVKHQVEPVLTSITSTTP